MTAIEDLPPYARSRIEVADNGCWRWTGPAASEGYGMANLRGRVRKLAHRYVYELLVGPIPEGRNLDHRCHNDDPSCLIWDDCQHRRCVNPEHVEPVTQRTNVLRGKTRPAENVAKEVCPQGHPYTYVDARGWRKCLECQRDQKRRKRRDEGVPQRPTTHCKRGHEFTEETTRWSAGKRHCKVCELLRGKKHLADRRKPCAGCGGPKGPGKCFRYCTTCRPRPAGPEELAA